MSISLKIDHISCQNCVNTIEKTLGKYDGIKEVNANLAESTINLEYDSGIISLDRIIEIMDGINYKVVGSERRFAVTGMHCASCVRRVEQSLEKLEGVIGVSVNLAEESASVEFIDSVVDEEQIIRQIQDSGYDATVIESSEGDEERKDEVTSRLSLNLKIAIPLTVVIFFLSHLHMFGITPLDDQVTFYILFALALPIQFYCGRQFYIGFWLALKNRTANMDTLVAVGTSAAFIYSIMATFFPSVITGSGQAVVVYYDTAAMIITLILFGRLMEGRARKATSDEINKLVRLGQKTVVVERNGEEMQIPIEEVSRGDIVIVKPGAKVPVDGTVISGYSSLDESMLTGEPVAREVNEGDRVLAGSINKSGLFKFKAEAVGDETTLNQIIETVRDIISSKANIQKLADKVASVFVPVVILLALTAFGAWQLLPADPDFSFALMIFIAVLIISCPCALGLATPTAIMVGSARGAKEGILIKSAQILENVKRIDTIVFDKTGTLSVGKPEVVEFKNTGSYTDEEILKFAASLEKGSEHPLSEAVLEYAKKRGIESVELSEFEYISGKGIKGRYDNHELLLGNTGLMEENMVEMKKALDIIENAQTEGMTALLLAVDGELAGVIGVADTIKAEAGEVIRNLKESGREIWLLSGDNKKVAQATALKLGIKNVMAEILPQDKSAQIAKLKGSGKSVAMVGDGINDAPALAEADVGIALGSGSDVAISFSDITLLGANLKGVMKALKLSERTLKTIKQNLWWAFGYNIIAIPLAAGVFYKSMGILLSPVVASAAMAFSSILVVTNSLRLRRIKL